MESHTSPTPPALRTEAYRERLEQRREELRQQLVRLLPPGRPFVWEVGCGHGHFLTAYAQAHSDKTCIGIDLMGERIARALRKRDRARLENLHFLQADARLFLEVLPAGLTFTRLFVLFPDPWPKVRHHKHRILKSDFLSAAAHYATPDARLYFRTDYAPYFEAAKSAVASHDSWQPVEEAWAFEFGTVFQERATQHQSLVARRRAPASS
jgi:tRNA (guanine-N7-)-methyltransferase